MITKFLIIFLLLSVGINIWLGIEYGKRRSESYANTDPMIRYYDHGLVSFLTDRYPNPGPYYITPNGKSIVMIIIFLQTNPFQIYRLEWREVNETGPGGDPHFMDPVSYSIKIVDGKTRIISPGLASYTLKNWGISLGGDDGSVTLQKGVPHTKNPPGLMLKFSDGDKIECCVPIFTR